MGNNKGGGGVRRVGLCGSFCRVNNTQIIRGFLFVSLLTRLQLVSSTHSHYNYDLNINKLIN